MKKKGFTLIELIVVIAIIGVLAAILVPAMLGYVKKSKITSANSSAKSIATATQSALTDMDTQDKFKIARWDATVYSMDPNADNKGWYIGDASGKFDRTVTGITGSKFPNSTNNGLYQFMFKVGTYFKDIRKLSAVAISITKGNCDGVAVVNGNYPGTAPTQYSVDDYDSTVTYGSAIGSDKGTKGQMLDLLDYAGVPVLHKGTGEMLTLD